MTDKSALIDSREQVLALQSAASASSPDPTTARQADNQRIAALLAELETTGAQLSQCRTALERARLLNVEVREAAASYEAAIEAERQDKIALEREKADLQGEFQRASMSLTALETELVRSQEEVVRAKEQLLRVEAHGQEEVTLAQAELARFRAAEDAQSRELQRVYQGYEHAQAARADADARYSAVVSSTSWRATAPVRRFGSSHPAVAVVVRRALKLVWWTVTFQIVTRLRSRAQNRG